MSDERGGSGSGPGSDGERKRLDRLFEEWSRQGPDAEAVTDADPAADEAEMATAGRAQFDVFRLWVTVAVLMVAVSVWTMWLTRHEVAYWMKRGSEPVELGNLKERWTQGEQLDVASNSYVRAEGLFVTHESTLKTKEEPGASPDDEGSASARRYFVCPMFDIVVRTPEPFPDKPYHRTASIEIDEELRPLLEKRKAFPQDLTVTVDVEGRLLRPSRETAFERLFGLGNVSAWLRDPVEHFAAVTRQEPHEMWLLLENETPSRYGGFAVAWGAAILVILTAVALVVRAGVRRRRAG